MKKTMVGLAGVAMGVCACGAGNYADTVVYGTIRTAETENPVAEALAVKDGKFVYVGDRSGAAAFVKDGVTRIVDHRGKGMVMPSCTDGHAHYLMPLTLDSMKGGVLFKHEDAKADVLRKIDAAARAAKEAGKKCLFGFGWNYYIIMPDKPTLKELDAATHGVSTVVFDSSGHNALCNSECLRRCGIIDGKGKVLISKIDGGVLELDEKGYPTGFVDERVTGYLTRMGGIDADEIVDDKLAETAILKSQELLLSTGYVTYMEGWSNMLHPTKYYEAANKLDKEGKLKIILPMTYEVEPWQKDMDRQIGVLASLKEKYGTRHVRPEHLKIFMDGCLETKTGAISRPYKSGAVYKSFWSVDRLAGITRDCNARGLTVHTHAMGDDAITEATDAYVKGGDGKHRNCLVHIRHPRKEDFRRFAENNIACTAGMTWHVGTAESIKTFMSFFDEYYAKHPYPIKSFFDAGVKVTSHSDYPANEICPQDPFGIMAIAVSGQMPNPATGELTKPFYTEELVTREQAFQALTLNGAWQVGLENERGSIKVGKWADFVLADQDVFDCPVTDIRKTKVVSTWFEGERVYQAPAEAAGRRFTREELAYMPATTQIELFQQGLLTPSEVLEAQISRVKEFNGEYNADRRDLVKELDTFNAGKVNAITFDCFAEARKLAKEAERRYRDGTARRLEGVTVGVKDDCDVKGWRTDSGSLINKDEPAAETDDEFIARLRAEGAIFVFQTTVPEFCSSSMTWSRLYGVTRNPWNLPYGVGGSSGGSAAAVASGFCTLATGSDMAGSIRLPASMNGVWGFKSPLGRVPCGESMYMGYGPLARTFGDMVLMQDVLAGPSDGVHCSIRPKLEYPAHYAPIRGEKVAVAYMKDWLPGGIDADETAALDRTVEALARAGAEVVKVDLGWTAKDNTMRTIVRGLTADAGAAQLVAMKAHPELLCANLAAFFDNTKGLDLEAIHEAQDLRGALNRELQELVFRKGCIALVMPTLATAHVPADVEATPEKRADVNGKPFDSGVVTLTPAFNLMNNYPIVTVPAGFSSRNVPIGVQVIGNTFDDIASLRVSAALSKTLKPNFRDGRFPDFRSAK